MREHLAAFQRAGIEGAPVRTLDELGSVDALSIPGGESTTMSRLLRAFHLEEPLRERLENGMPTFSTCAGMILLSRNILDGTPDQISFGILDIDVRRNAYGRQVESFEYELPIPAIGAPSFHSVFIRAPSVEKIGADVEVIAEYEGKPVAIRQGKHLSFAFHPEMTDDIRLHELFVKNVQAARSVA